MTERSLHTVVETEVSLRLAQDLVSQDERDAVGTFSARNPQAGRVIPGTRGMRKARVPLAGRGKRGGARVITDFVAESAAYLLPTYAKKDQGNLTPDQGRLLARLVDDLL